MEKWYPEDWHFNNELLKVGTENKAIECRLGLEPGDTFECDYGTPAGLCPTSFIKIFPAIEVLRCGSDLRNLGSSAAHEMEFMCPDGAVRFKIAGIKHE